MRPAVRAYNMQKKAARGATLVEFALVLIMFLMLLLGIIDFGRFFFVQHTLQFATREGTRLALVGGILTDPQGNPLSRSASIVKKIKDNAALAVDPAQMTISIYKITATYTDPGAWQGQQNAGNPGDYMRVRTQYTYRFLTPLIGQFFTGGVNLIQAEATYRNEMF
jgi:Flp pilus assembly protein TadG